MKRHEKEFEQYLKDWKKHERPWELWETSRRNGLGCWFGWIPMDDTDSCYFGFESWDFRRKPDTVTFCGVKVRKPLTIEPERGDPVWAFTPEYEAGYCDFYYDCSRSWNKSLFKNGCLHDSKEAVLEWVKVWKEKVLSQLKE